ncbi:MAG: DUF4124 domain-containing protein [Pseudomonadota bacterium]|nr:DUF4124 domain-containing protein [Pseudomonadota bacterium]
MKTFGYTALLFVGTLFGSAQVTASAIYKWVDQHGVTQYTQSPPPPNAKNKQTVQVSRHIPADVREGRARGMVDASTLDAERQARNAPVGSPNQTSPNPQSNQPVTGNPSEPTEVSEQPITDTPPALQ